jgi:hypothetical protein
VYDKYLDPSSANYVGTFIQPPTLEAMREGITATQQNLSRDFFNAAQVPDIHPYERVVVSDDDG